MLTLDVFLFPKAISLRETINMIISVHTSFILFDLAPGNYFLLWKKFSLPPVTKQIQI